MKADCPERQPNLRRKRKKDSLTLDYHVTTTTFRGNPLLSASTITLIENKMNDFPRDPHSFVEYWLALFRLVMRAGDDVGAPALRNHYRGERSGTGSKLAALSSINFLPANPIVEKDFIIYWIQNNQPERA